MLEPPRDVAPDVLFRKLIELPRPTAPVDFTIYGAEGITLTAQALKASEFVGSASDVACRALLANGARAFASAEEMDRALGVREYERLTVAVMRALGQCSPVDGRSNWKAWHRVLLEGARHATNQETAYMLGSQVELLGKLAVSRPERFFGIPPINLVDAHSFASRAARAYFFDLHRGV